MTFDDLIGKHLNMTVDFDAKTGKSIIGKQFIDDLREGPMGENVVMLRREGADSVPVSVSKFLSVVEENCKIYGEDVVFADI